MSAAAKTGRQAIRLANQVVNTVVWIVVLLLLVFGFYAIWDSKQVHSAADAARYAVYKPSAENEGLSFQELQTINADVFAWLTVYGTHIDYPVVQGENNMKYINTDAKGKYSLSGAIFLDYNSNPDFSDFNSILYGHHMAKQTMFGEIGQFSDKSYFNARKYGALYYGGQEHGLVFFAFVHADAYNGSVFQTKISGREAQQAYLDMLMRIALHTREDVPVTVEDRIVLLSTCSANSTNGRDILIGKITGEIYSDPFETEKTDKPNIPVIDELSNLWTQAPIGCRIILAALPFLLILLALVLTYTKKKKRSLKRRAATPKKGDEQR